MHDQITMEDAAQATLYLGTTATNGHLVLRGFFGAQIQLLYGGY